MFRSIVDFRKTMISFRIRRLIVRLLLTFGLFSFFGMYLEPTFMIFFVHYILCLRFAKFQTFFINMAHFGSEFLIAIILIQPKLQFYHLRRICTSQFYHALIA